VNTTQRSLSRRALESDVLSANLLAEGIKRDLDDRLTELEAIAADEDLRQAVVDFALKPREDRQPLWDLLNGFKKQNDRRWSGLGRSLDDSWFLQDEKGYQRWRDVISMSLDGNYDYRDYFHGSGFHYTEGEVPVGVVPIRKRYVCVPYRGTTTQQFLIALSVPVFAPGDDTRVIGVLARSLSLSSLLLDYEKSLRSQRADGIGRKFAIVDSRMPSNGPREWKLLAHDWMTKANLAELNKPGAEGFEQLRLLGVADEDLLLDLEKLVAMTDSVEGRHEYDRTHDYIDPVQKMDPATYGGEWLAAFSPVGDTGWVAIVQERKLRALQPVEELKAQLYSWALGAVLLGLGLVAGSWWMIVMLLNERGPRWLKFWHRQSSSTGTTTLSLTSKGGDSA
ncbi:MAG: cache domain-containing protein, partial [Candidatus Saccharimonas sp.]|nr:cache domain-containing protein [Planctomycetaceae bacterium]